MDSLYLFPPDDNTSLKRCSGCKQFKPPTNVYFASNRSAHDHLQSECKECSKKRRDAKRAEKPQKEYIILDVKKCNQCDEEKPNTEEYFHKRRSKDERYKLSTICKECKNKSNKKYIEENKDKVKLKDKKYRESNRPAVLARMRRYYQDNKEKFKQSNHQYYLDNREERQVYRKRYYLSNQELIKEKRRVYRKTHTQQVRESRRKHSASHREQIQKYQREYRKGHILEGRQYKHRRRARLRKIGGSYTAQDIQQKFKKQKGKCYYCHQRLTKYHIDHVTPITREGSNNSANNIVLACPTCNCRKNNKLPHEWPEGGRLL